MTKEAFRGQSMMIEHPIMILNPNFSDARNNLKREIKANTLTHPNCWIILKNLLISPFQNFNNHKVLTNSYNQLLQILGMQVKIFTSV